MSEKKEDPFGMMSMVEALMNSMGPIWSGMAGQWAGAQGADKKTMETENSKAQKNMAAALKYWQAMGSAMATPESMSALLRGGGVMPDLLSKLAQSSLSGFWEMQQNIIERLGSVSASAEAYEFKDIDENNCRMWTDIYENEFKQFFHIPQLGLMRTYQERVQQLGDKYNIFQSTLSEFLNLLSLPFSRSMPVMQEKIAEMSENGTLSDDPKFYYTMWVKVLEGHYMTLYQTPEYVETLVKTINNLADFTAARDLVIEDLLSQLPVARQSELDDMARELYELKKRLRKLEKEHKK